MYFLLSADYCLILYSFTLLIRGLWSIVHYFQTREFTWPLQVYPSAGGEKVWPALAGPTFFIIKKEQLEVIILPNNLLAMTFYGL